MKTYGYKYWFCILLCLLPKASNLAATIDDGGMVCLTLNDGLAGEVVNRVMTDHIGRAWIATNNGVNLYNGKRLTTFQISDGKWAVAVRDLCETKSGNIYAATDAGLFLMNKGSGRFERVLPEVTRPISLLAVGDTLYIGGQQGFQMYDDKGRLTHINVGASGQGLDNVVRQYAEGDNGEIWFLYRYDLGCYHPQTGVIDRYSLRGVLPDGLPLTQFARVGNRFFIGTTQNGLYVYDLKTKMAERLAGVGNIVKTVSLSNDGYICVATDGAGAFRIDPKTNVIVERFTTEGHEGRRLPTNAVYSYYRDSNGVNWFGFIHYGLSYTAHSEQVLRLYQTDNFTTKDLNVRSFCLRGSESVIGTQSGFWYVDSIRHICRYFSPEELGGGHIVKAIVWFKGDYYIGTFDGGLRVLNPQTLTLRRLTEAPLLGGTPIGDIKVGPDGRLWIGSDKGLFLLTKDAGQMDVRRFTEQNSHIMAGNIISISFDHRGNAWLTHGTGISLYSAASGEILKPNFPDEGFFDKIPFMQGTLGHDSLILMRSGPQLFYTTTDMKDFGPMTLPTFLEESWYRGFLDDRKGHYWIGTEHGLFCLNYANSEIFHFGNGEGLRGELINEMEMDAQGVLWVATSQGLFSLSPDDFRAWKQYEQYRVQLYDIRLGADLMDGAAECLVNENREIWLSWNFGSEVLQAGAVLMDYALQAGRIYEWRVDEGEWQVASDEKAISIRGLLPGIHRLEVRLAGMPVTTSVYTLKVLPSKWAFLELLLLLAALVWLWLWYRYRKQTKVLLTERNDIEEALIEAVESMEVEESIQKYQKVKIDEAECADIVRRMKQYVEKDKVYTNADLKMKDLSDVLHLSTSKLSQVFALYLKENYYDFINHYRLEEFKRLLASGEYKRYTITSLSEQCGFKKTNFYSTFRKVEGMTPAEYLKKRGVKMQ